MGVTGNSALDVAIGLSFVFFVLAVFAMAINEVISSFTQQRSNTLVKWLEDNLAKPNAGKAETDHAKLLVTRFYDHPAVNGLTPNRRGKSQKPSYIPSEHAITSLLDVGGGLAENADNAWHLGTVSGAEIEEAIQALPDSPIRNALKSAWLQAGKDVDQFRARAEKWFDDAMDRLSGFYKRRAQLILWLIGAVLAIGLNVDAIQIAETLYKDPSVRAIVAAQAASVKHTPDPSQAVSYLQDMPVPIGWGHLNFDVGWDTLLKAVGLLLTAAAVGMGAPFWFDTLSRLGPLRSTGPQPATASATPPAVTIISPQPAQPTPTPSEPAKLARASTTRRASRPRKSPPDG